jgi:hypothetical protein
MTPVRTLAFALALAATTTGCALGAEEAFTQGRSLDPCLQSIPACPGLSAHCALDAERYTRKVLPADTPIRFLVETDPGDRVEVTMLLATRRDAGQDTRILWYEPGCSDVYEWESEGRDLFEEAGPARRLVFEQRLNEGGEHVVEIVSDMQARVLIGVRVVPAPEPEPEETPAAQ